MRTADLRFEFVCQNIEEPKYSYIFNGKRQRVSLNVEKIMFRYDASSSLSITGYKVIGMPKEFHFND